MTGILGYELDPKILSDFQPDIHKRAFKNVPKRLIETPPGIDPVTQAFAVPDAELCKCTP